MDALRFRQAEAIFEELVATPPTERSSVLYERCGADRELRALVERVLENDRLGMGDFLRRPAGAAGSAPWTGPDLPPRIGRYEILREVGRGGMGVVYEARQEQPQRRVALKVIRQGLASPAMLRRFQYEAEMLGRLQHPGIAQIFEAGVADLGLPLSAVSVQPDESTPRSALDTPRWSVPFFAMEFVEGLPLTEYADQYGLGTEQRLDLMARVCDAVQHAHLKGIIHRDLKPGNILVADEKGEQSKSRKVDGPGEPDSSLMTHHSSLISAQPKILDFGVARVTGADVYTLTMHTEAGQLVGTLPYMSPEQAEGHTEQLDGRSDVYALGVILYQLIAARLPYDLAGLPIVKAARVICEQAPTPLGALNRACRGDLDTITRKALEKDPDRRYSSAAALAEDLRHFLRHEPIRARPASAAYQMRKFAQRNKALVGGIAATLVALVLGVIGTTYGMVQMGRQRDEARLQASIVQAANDFLTDDLLESADPQREPDRDIPMRVVLDRAADRIGDRFANAPVVEANLRKAIGKAYSHLHLLEQAEPHLQQAYELYRTARGEHDEDTLITRMELGALLTERGQFDRAEALFLELLDLQREALGPDHEQTIASLHSLGAIYLQQSRFDRAEPVLLETLDLRRRVLGEDHKHTAVTLMNLGVLFQYTGRQAQAVEMLNQALDIHLRVSGEEYPETLKTLANLGVAYYGLTQYDSAAESLERALELSRRVLGEEHRDTLKYAANLAVVYGKLQRPERAELLRQTLEVQRRVLGEDHQDTLVTRSNLIRVAFDNGDYETAEAEYAGLIEDLDRAMPVHWITGVAYTMHGKSLYHLGQFAAAEQSLLRAYDIQAQIHGPEHERTCQVVDAMIELYAQWGKPDLVARWRLHPGGPSETP